jgi:formylglycine-generating enzyme required for sulfatase activity
VPDIFLSYNREDQGKAKLIAKALSDEGFDVWWDTVLRAGQTYDEVTERQLHESRAVVVLWSSRSVKSKWVRAEATLGDRKSALIPVMIEACDRPIMFELIQTADLIGWEGDTDNPGWRAFVADVREHVERKAAAGKPTSSAATPEMKPASAKSETLATAETIEAAFWMSIQDGDDPEEFESYLERYPNGHFAALARKRLSAMTAARVAASPPSPAPSAPEPVRAPLAPAPEPLFRTPPQAAPRVDPFQKKAAPPRKKSSGPMPLVIGGVAAVAIAAAAFVLVPGILTPAAPGEPIQQASGPLEAPPALVSAVATDAPVQTAGAPAEPAAPQPPVASATFRDCDECPELMRLPGGVFAMGSPATEAGHRAWEGPQRDVTIAPLAIGIREVTFGEWEACVAAGGCGNYTPTDRGWGRGARPVIMVSWNDAQGYVGWLSKKTGKSYRLPTEAEWEYAARGGTRTAYWWGDRFETARAPTGKTAEVGSGEANGFGLHDVTGNVAEWVEDCYVNSFAAAPRDGSAVVSGNCQRVIRGGGWRANASDLRIANRSRLAPTTRDAAIGFRVVAAE